METLWRVFLVKEEDFLLLSNHLHCCTESHLISPQIGVLSIYHRKVQEEPKDIIPIPCCGHIAFITINPMSHELTSSPDAALWVIN